MLYGKLRIHTCRVILLTSLVWFLIDVVILSFYSECLGGSCRNREERSEPEALVGDVAGYDDAERAPAPSKRSRGRGAAVAVGQSVPHLRPFDVTPLAARAPRAAPAGAARRTGPPRQAAPQQGGPRQGEVQAEPVQQVSSAAAHYLHSDRFPQRGLVDAAEDRVERHQQVAQTAAQGDHPDYLGKQLEEYVSKLPVPTYVYRTEKRSGLIRARLLGDHLPGRPLRVHGRVAGAVAGQDLRRPGHSRLPHHRRHLRRHLRVPRAPARDGPSEKRPYGPPKDPHDGRGAFLHRQGILLRNRLL
ncbi:unnamed protein product [Callosobruchus maculatus]|uniref:Uncharacterized protein n=1 Tax=Callosobruchus maculatus TaxID=64391 RepID=A0A653C607_CALMS|nr:unnamed protein product [Callosobruchus maculatus]